MNTYIRYNEFPTFFDRVVARQLARPAARPAFYAPAVNVKEDGTSFHIEVAAPGLKKDEFKVNVEGLKLTISYQHEATETEKAENFTLHEFSTNAFTRSFRLPKNVNADQIQASYTDGILKLDLPKVDVKAIETKEIAVA